MALQTDFTPYQQPLFVGFPTMPFADCFTRRGRIYVPNNGTAPKPGDAVIWDASRKSYKLPTSAAEAGQLDGIIVLSQQHTGVTYANNDPIIVMERGNLAVIAGDAVAFRQIVQWQTDDQKWDAYTLEVAAAADISGQTAVAGLQGEVNDTVDDIETNVNAALNVETMVKCASKDGGTDGSIIEISVNLV
ncbi:MAG: hypothetical protein OXI59_17690 [Gemmatimonadota bacterium]|nr:hypothetical protein [Gemmatimonadota bacterium]